MNIVLWIGNEPNQRALAAKISEHYPLSGIITESRKRTSPKKIGTLVNKILSKLFLSSVDKAWMGMHRFYSEKYPSFPNTELLDVENINSNEAFEFTAKLKPDLILVSGTRLIKDRMLSFSKDIPILNLHTGLSPYIKGGPNCTNWCISTGQYHLIGNTVMWLDIGIDTGNIFTSELTDLDAKDDLNQIHIKVMEHAHELYLKAIRAISENNRQSYPQHEISQGTTYYNKQWNFKTKLQLLKNVSDLKKNIASGKVNELKKNIRTILIR